MTKLGVTPAQTIGPFFHYALPYDDGSVIAHEGVPGEHIVVEGRVLDGAGAPVPDALVEVWQANAAGRYDHPDDARGDIALTNGFRGFGRVPTDKEGRFRFQTIKPGPVPGPGNTLQAPHLMVTIFARGLLNHVTTRIYFADDEHNDNDPILALIPEAERKATLIASRAVDGPAIRYLRDIVLQGDNETVFFQV